VVGAAPTGGGSKGTEDDSIERQIARYTALAKNAQTAFATVFTGQNRYIDDLQREVRVQQQVDDIVARLAAKNHGAPTPEQIEALRQVVTIEQERRAETQKLLEAMTQAEALERRLGDGTKARAIAERDLARQRQTGILSPEAARRAETEQNERLRTQELTAKRTDDNLGSLTAGFENAANASVRAHDLFTTGGQAFEGLMGAMSESIDALVGASNKGFDQIARDFALMLAKMAAQAALSQVFKLAINALSSIGSGAAGGVSPGTVSPADWAAMLSANSGGAIAGMAGGGEVSAGRPYIVGERGPEFFVPNAAGSIVPMSQSGGGGVTVNVDMGQTVGASNPSQALDFGRKVRAAVMTVIQGEKRPGGTLHPATP
jgi:lambda family phage tail tape measure protein